MKFLPPIFPQTFYATLEELISAINIFIVIQRYVVIKKQTRKSKKDILQKAILIYNKNKIYINKRRSVKNTTLHKYNCLFDKIALTKHNK